MWVFGSGSSGAVGGLQVGSGLHREETQASSRESCRECWARQLSRMPWEALVRRAPHPVVVRPLLPRKWVEYGCRVSLSFSNKNSPPDSRWAKWWRGITSRQLISLTFGAIRGGNYHSPSCWEVTVTPGVPHLPAPNANFSLKSQIWG